MTDDKGVHDMFNFMLARDTMHQNQWLAAIEELESDGLESTPVPASFNNDVEYKEYAYQLMDCSAGDDSRRGRWASGTSKDGRGTFEWVQAKPMGEAPLDLPADPRVYGTPKSPMAAMAGKAMTAMADGDGLVDKVKKAVSS